MDEDFNGNCILQDLFLADIQIKIKLERQRSSKTERQIDRQLDRQIDGLINRQMIDNVYTQIDKYIYIVRQINS